VINIELFEKLCKASLNPFVF